MNKYLYILISTYSIFLVPSENPGRPASFSIETSSRNLNQINQTLNLNEKKAHENKAKQASNANDDDSENNAKTNLARNPLQDTTLRPLKELTIEEMFTNFTLPFFQEIIKEEAKKCLVAHLFITADKEKKEHLKDPIGRILLKDELEKFIPELNTYHKRFLSKECDDLCPFYPKLACELFEKLREEKYSLQKTEMASFLFLHAVWEERILDAIPEDSK